MKNFSFPFRAALATTFFTFCFFLASIYLEDYFIFYPGSNKFVRSIDPEIYLGRILFAMAFSISNGVIIFLFVNGFITHLMAFSRMILDWSRNHFSDFELLQDSGIKEINHIKEVFHSSVYAVKARETKGLSDIVNENNKLFIEQILESLHSIQLVKLEDLDIHIFPLNTRNPGNDLIGFVPTRNGCILLMVGFKKQNVLTIAYKARIQSILQMMKHLNFTVEEELISAMQDSIRPYPIEGLNFTLLYAVSDSRLLKFLHFQENPILLYANGELREMPVIGETQYPFMDFSSDIRMEKIPGGTFIVALTDRIWERPAFGKNKYISDLKKLFSTSKKSFQTSQEFYVFLRSSLESIFKNNGGTENLDDFLSVIVLKIF